MLRKTIMEDSSSSRTDLRPLSLTINYTANSVRYQGHYCGDQKTVPAAETIHPCPRDSLKGPHGSTQDGQGGRRARTRGQCGRRTTHTEKGRFVYSLATSLPARSRWPGKLPTRSGWASGNRAREELSPSSPRVVLWDLKRSPGDRCRRWQHLACFV